MEHIFTITFLATVHTKAKELQCKTGNKQLFKLKKIGSIENESCTFCEKDAENVFHLFLIATYNNGKILE